MPIIAILVIVVVVIVLSKTGISGSLIGLVIATVAGLLTGSGTAGIASVALTPFLGIPIGLFIGVTVFAKVLRWFSRR